MAFIDITQLAFIIVSIYILTCIVLTLSVSKTMQSAYWLILMLVGVAVLFLLANSEYLFFVQLSVYSGGIAVLLLFAALLADHDQFLFRDTGFAGIWQQAVVSLLVGISLITMTWTALTSEEYTHSGTLGDTTIQTDTAKDILHNFTNELWTTYGLLIPLLAALLLAALLGSVKLVIREYEVEEDLPQVIKERYGYKEATAR